MYPRYVAELDRLDRRRGRAARASPRRRGRARGARTAGRRAAARRTPPTASSCAAAGAAPWSASVALVARSRARRARRGRESRRCSRRAAATSRRCCAPPTTLRREVNGDTVTYVVTRNVNYTNVCYFRCGFCAFSKGTLADDLRGEAVPRRRSTRSSAAGSEAWERGATEICLQGGIHPAFTGDYYLDVCRAAEGGGARTSTCTRSRALEVWQGAAHARPAARRLPRAASRRRSRVAAGHGGRDPRRRGARRDLPRQGHDASSGSRCTTRRTASACARRPRSCSVTSTRRALGAAPAAPARAAAAQRRLHRVRAAAVRAHGGADLPQGPRAPGADVPRGDPDARGRAARAAPADHERPGVVGEARARRRAGRAARPARTTSAAR